MSQAIIAILKTVIGSPAALSVLAGVLVWLLRTILKDRWTRVENILESGTEVAYNVVQSFAPATPNTVDDQVAQFLKSFHDYLVAHGHEATPAQDAKAVAVFKAMSGHP